ncbi:hypothetical protein A6M21_01830 [Desulfotomaculum copahuensis]|uniref:Uncharacterized protein n=1 Tax=Desulfotomaculum copahuensis TaxID=1838280 RepID=A0A1B7LKR5_9FIRM|nr:hypothetical protein A6M21_01830 [Desulfotomaculum copahuensis]
MPPRPEGKNTFPVRGFLLPYCKTVNAFAPGPPAGVTRSQPDGEDIAGHGKCKLCTCHCGRRHGFNKLLSPDRGIGAAGAAGANLNGGAC